MSRPSHERPLCGTVISMALYVLALLGLILLGVLTYAMITAMRAAQKSAEVLAENLGRMAEGHTQAVGAVAESANTAIRELTSSSQAASRELLAWLDRNQGVGGVPRDLWMKRNELDQKKLDMQAAQLERQMQLSEPMIQETLERAARDARVNALRNSAGKGRRSGANGRVTSM